ncbi:MAG: hypothetical protein Fur0012_11910 [Elusimicrobiota bacterium]
MLPEFDMKSLKEYCNKYMSSSKSEKSKILGEYISLCHIPHKIISRIRNDKRKIIKKVYYTAKTPYKRLIECKKISDELKKELTQIFNSLNLVELKKK